jgi:hypothetical protein
MDEGFYLVEENLTDGIDNSKAEDASLVDIGGDVGHDCEEFLRKFPGAHGRLILQDLTIIIGQITDLEARIERKPYDFYEEQLVKGKSLMP